MTSPKGEENWIGALFAQTELLRTCWHLERGKLRLPADRNEYNVPLCRLDELADIGPDYARVVEGFTVSTDEWSPYPGFWHHDSKKVRTIHQKNNCWLVSRYDSPRGPNYGSHLWERSGDILVVSRLRTNTHRVIAIGLPNRTLGSTWWALNCRQLNRKQRKSMLLWLNGSLSLLLYFGRRAITEAAWMQMKQPAWASMPVLNVRTLSDKQLNVLSAAYDHISKKDLQALAKLDQDPARSVIDEAICTALNIADLHLLRELISREPGLSGKPIDSSSPIMQGSLFSENEDDPQENLFR